MGIRDFREKKWQDVRNLLKQQSLVLLMILNILPVFGLGFELSVLCHLLSHLLTYCHLYNRFHK